MEIQGWSPDRIVRAGVVHVPEGREVFPLLSVEDNLRMGAYTRSDKDGVATVEYVDAAVSYYGGGVGDLVKSGVVPKVPTICHFGMNDVWIPVDVVDAVAAAWPDTTVYRYDANHGFHCDHRADFDQASSDAAQERTLAFFAEQLA